MLHRHYLDSEITIYKFYGTFCTFMTHQWAPKYTHFSKVETYIVYLSTALICKKEKSCEVKSHCSVRHSFAFSMFHVIVYIHHNFSTPLYSVCRYLGCHHTLILNANLQRTFLNKFVYKSFPSIYFWVLEYTNFKFFWLFLNCFSKFFLLIHIFKYLLICMCQILFMALGIFDLCWACRSRVFSCGMQTLSWGMRHLVPWVESESKVPAVGSWSQPLDYLEVHKVVFKINLQLQTNSAWNILSFYRFINTILP